MEMVKKKIHRQEGKQGNENRDDYALSREATRGPDIRGVCSAQRRQQGTSRSSDAMVAKSVAPASHTKACLRQQTGANVEGIH